MLRTVLAYDFWKTTHAWAAVERTHTRAEATANMIAQALAGDRLGSILARRSEMGDASSRGDPTDDVLRSLFMSDIATTFDQLANLGNMFEELCREWCLPTYLGMLTQPHANR